jgi:periplasmic divalent cation tolerance protein
VPITGAAFRTYRLAGQIETARQYLWLIKTRQDLFARVKSAIIKLHSYETTEINAVPISKGSDDYFKWMNQSLAGKI